MSIFKFLGQLFKTIFPFLMSAAEKAFKKLPIEKQEELIKISKMVEIIKQMWGLDVWDVVEKIKEITGFDEAQISHCIANYCLEKGLPADDLDLMIMNIWHDASKRTETGLKSLWAGIGNIVSSVVAEIDWKVLLLGVGEFVYRNFVKGKVKI